MAAILLQSRAPGTLGGYLTHIGAFERWLGVPFEEAVPISEATLQRYLLHMVAEGKSSSTLNGVISAVGTFHAFLNLERVRPEGFSYILDGNAPSGPPPKSKLPGAPLQEFFARVDAAMALPPDDLAAVI